MWELDEKEGWALKSWRFWIVVLAKTLKSPLDCKEIKAVHPKGNQPWIFIGLMLKLKLHYFGHLMRRANSLEKTLMWEKLRARGEGGDRGWRATEYEMVGWHHWLNGHKFEQTQGEVSLMDREAWHAAVHKKLGSQRVGHDLVTEQQQEHGLSRSPFMGPLGMSYGCTGKKLSRSQIYL